jgi:hypothetical protein
VLLEEEKKSYTKSYIARNKVERLVRAMAWKGL